MKPAGAPGHRWQRCRWRLPVSLSRLGLRVCVFPWMKQHPASLSVPTPPPWKLPFSLSVFPTNEEAYFGRNRHRHQGTRIFVLFYFCHLVAVLLSSLKLSVPQFSVYKLEMASATNLPPGLSEGFVSWLPSLELPSSAWESPRTAGRLGRWAGGWFPCGPPTLPFSYLVRVFQCGIDTLEMSFLKEDSKQNLDLICFVGTYLTLRNGWGQVGN